MSKMTLWLIFVVSAIIWQIGRELLFRTGSVSDAVNSIYWTGAAYLIAYMAD